MLPACRRWGFDNSSGFALSDTPGISTVSVGTGAKCTQHPDSVDTCTSFRFIECVREGQVPGCSYDQTTASWG
jgi:hypothetical protein